MILGFPHSSVGKESACSAGDPGSIPGSGRSPGEGISYPLQCSGLENPMDYTVHGAAKSWTQLSDFGVHFFRHMCVIAASRVGPPVSPFPKPCYPVPLPLCGPQLGRSISQSLRGAGWSLSLCLASVPGKVSGGKRLAGARVSQCWEQPLQVKNIYQQANSWQASECNLGQEGIWPRPEPPPAPGR